MNDDQPAELIFASGAWVSGRQNGKANKGAEMVKFWEDRGFRVTVVGPDSYTLTAHGAEFSKSSKRFYFGEDYDGPADS